MCIGKSFAEMEFKVAVIIIMKLFQGKLNQSIGEFAEPSFLMKKPANNALIRKRPQIKIRFNVHDSMSKP